MAAYQQPPFNLRELVRICREEEYAEYAQSVMCKDRGVIPIKAGGCKLVPKVL